MPYCLKPGQESFEVVDGLFAGKKFEKGVQYDTIPESEARRFESAAPAAPVKAGQPEPEVMAWVPEPDPEPDKPTKKGAK